LGLRIFYGEKCCLFYNDSIKTWYEKTLLNSKGILTTEQYDKKSLTAKKRNPMSARAAHKLLEKMFGLFSLLLRKIYKMHLIPSL
jgi:hypothetical protein